MEIKPNPLTPGREKERGKMIYTGVKTFDGLIAEIWLENEAHQGNPIALLDLFTQKKGWDTKRANDAFYDVWENSQRVGW